MSIPQFKLNHPENCLSNIIFFKFDRKFGNMVKSTVIFLLLLFLFDIAYCNKKKRLSREDYIEKYAEVAIEEMKKYNVPASITLAQGCLESGNGNSFLAQKANNHFGIKCNNGWDGPSVRHDDDERNECFRKYRKAWDSYRDHSRFLTDNVRYASLFDLDISDYKGWSKGLKKAGYATDPKYHVRLINIIEEHELYKYDSHYKKDIARSGRKGEKSEEHLKGETGIDHFSINPFNRREIGEINGREYVIAKEEDSYLRIADEFDLQDWEICAYNDVHKEANPPVGSIIFLKSKRSRASKGNNFHMLQAGEGMWHVSQKYGIRLKALYRKNRMKQGDSLKVGQKIWLRKCKPKD